MEHFPDPVLEKNYPFDKEASMKARGNASTCGNIATATRRTRLDGPNARRPCWAFFYAETSAHHAVPSIARRCRSAKGARSLVSAALESIASPHVRPSPNGRRVGIRIVTFEASSGFTHVTAHRMAQPPKATFVTRLQPCWLPGRAAR
jgi:hypothetical protein